MPSSYPNCAGTRRRALFQRLWGFGLGLAIAAIAIDYGRHTAPSTPSPLPSAQTLTHYPGP